MTDVDQKEKLTQHNVIKLFTQNSVKTPNQGQATVLLMDHIGS